MFTKVTDKTFTLLASMNNFPRGMIQYFVTVYPDATRAMFIYLFGKSRIWDNK